MIPVTTPTIPMTTRQHDRPSAVSRWSFRASLISFIVALAYILAMIIFHQTHIPPPPWAYTAQRIVPAVDVILGAVGVLLNLAEMLRIVVRAQAFDPKDAGKEFALDDATDVLIHLRQGCFARIAIPLALITAVAALLLSLLAPPGFDRLRLSAQNLPQSCATSLSPFTFELDNSSSTVGVSWSASPVETLADGEPWAQVQPAQGSLQPGQTFEAQVIPNVLVCRYLAQARLSASTPTGHAYAAMTPQGTATYHVKVTIDGQTKRSSTLDMSLESGPPPPASPPVLSVTPTQTTTIDCSPRTITFPPISVRNIGGQTLHWRSAPSLGSTTITPSSGSVAPGQSQTVSVTQPGPASTASNISIVSDGGQTLVHFTCAPMPTPVPPAPTRTPTPPPAHANLVVSPPNKNASENCNGGPAAPYSITLDNTGSNVSVGWQFSASGGWATASPSSNTIAAGQTATIQVTPSVCPSPGTATTYQATLHLTFPQGSSQADIALTDHITGPAPVVNFVASFQATGNQRFNDTCYPTNSTLPAITVTLDNTLSNVPVSWTWEGVTTDGTSVGSPWQWASPSPPGATVPAGQKTTMQATPLFPCPAVGGNTYTAGAVLQLTFPQGGSQGNPFLVYTVTEQTPVF